MTRYEFSIVDGRMGGPATVSAQPQTANSALLNRLKVAGQEGWRAVGTSTDVTGWVSVLMERPLPQASEFIKTPDELRQPRGDLSR